MAQSKSRAEKPATPRKPRKDVADANAEPKAPRVRLPVASGWHGRTTVPAAACNALTLRDVNSALTEAYADLAWLEDRLMVNEGSRGPEAEIRFALFADPEADLPSLRELIKRAREDEKAQAEEAADRGGD